MIGITPENIVEVTTGPFRMWMKRQWKKFATKPTDSVWKYVAIALIIERLFTKFILYVAPLELGLLTPGATIATFDDMLSESSVEVSRIFFRAFQQMFIIGHTIAVQNASLAWWMAQSIGYGIFGALLFVLTYCAYGVLRHIVYYLKKQYSSLIKQ